MFPCLDQAVEDFDEAVTEEDPAAICTSSRVLYLEFDRIYRRCREAVEHEVGVRVDELFRNAIEVLSKRSANDSHCANYLRNVKDRRDSLQPYIKEILRRVQA